MEKNTKLKWVPLQSPERDNTSEIKDLCEWKRLTNTDKRPNSLFAEPSEKFWDAWRERKEFLKQNGVRIFKSKNKWVLEWRQDYKINN